MIGVSPDSETSHQKFREKHGLEFLLLSDVNRRVASLYGVLKAKTVKGKKPMGIERSTFIIDEKGAITKVFRKVKVEGHTDEVLGLL